MGYCGKAVQFTEKVGKNRRDRILPANIHQREWTKTGYSEENRPFQRAGQV